MQKLGTVSTTLFILISCIFAVPTFAQTPTPTPPVFEWTGFIAPTEYRTCPTTSGQSYNCGEWTTITNYQHMGITMTKTQPSFSDLGAVIQFRNFPQLYIPSDAWIPYFHVALTARISNCPDQKVYPALKKLTPDYNWYNPIDLSTGAITPEPAYFFYLPHSTTSTKPQFETFNNGVQSYINSSTYISIGDWRGGLQNYVLYIDTFNWDTSGYNGCTLDIDSIYLYFAPQLPYGAGTSLNEELTECTPNKFPDEQPTDLLALAGWYTKKSIYDLFVPNTCQISTNFETIQTALDTKVPFAYINPLLSLNPVPATSSAFPSIVLPVYGQEDYTLEVPDFITNNLSTVKNFVNIVGWGAWLVFVLKIVFSFFR